MNYYPIRILTEDSKAFLTEDSPFRASFLLQDVLDLFEATHKIECLKRQVKEIEVPKKMVMYWFSQSVQDILREVKEFEAYTDLTLISGTYDYVLPDNFSFVLNVWSNNCPLIETSLDKISTTQSTTASKYAIYSDGLIPHILFDGTPKSPCRVRYQTSTSLYSPSGDSTKSVGVFDGFSALGGIYVVDFYVPTILAGMLSNLFPDKKEEYLFEMQKLKNNRVVSYPDQTVYTPVV